MKDSKKLRRKEDTRVNVIVGKLDRTAKLNNGMLVSKPVKEGIFSFRFGLWAGGVVMSERGYLRDEERSEIKIVPRLRMFTGLATASNYNWLGDNIRPDDVGFIRRIHSRLIPDETVAVSPQTAVVLFNLLNTPAGEQPVEFFMQMAQKDFEEEDIILALTELYKNLRQAYKI